MISTIPILLCLALGTYSEPAPESSVRCSCIVPPAPTAARAAATAVFVGTVVSRREITLEVDGSDIAIPALAVTFRLEAVWKGVEPGEETVEVTTGFGGGDCGFPFVRGGTYLVYAGDGAPRLTTSVCTRTALATLAEEDLEALGPPLLMRQGSGRR